MAMTVVAGYIETDREWCKVMDNIPVADFDRIAEGKHSIFFVHEGKGDKYLGCVCITVKNGRWWMEWSEPAA